MSQGKGKPIIRPFCQSAGVSCRRYSIPLQRIITDFGADVPFGRIPKKLQEHYGITVPVSSAQKITQDHAARVLREHQTQTQIPTSMGVEQLIVEMDGSMIPIVETESTSPQDKKIDRRKTRTVSDTVGEFKKHLFRRSLVSDLLISENEKYEF